MNIINDAWRIDFSGEGMDKFLQNIKKMLKPVKHRLIDGVAMKIHSMKVPFTHDQAVSTPANICGIQCLSIVWKKLSYPKMVVGTQYFGQDF